MGITRKPRKEEQLSLRATHFFYLIHIPIRYCEKLVSYRLYDELKAVRECKLHKIIIKQSKGHNSETKKAKATVIVRDTFSCLDIHSYKISCRHSKGSLRYGAYTNFSGEHVKIIKGA